MQWNNDEVYFFFTLLGDEHTAVTLRTHDVSGAELIELKFRDLKEIGIRNIQKVYEIIQELQKCQTFFDFVKSSAFDNAFSEGSVDSNTTWIKCFLNKEIRVFRVNELSLGMKSLRLKIAQEFGLKGDVKLKLKWEEPIDGDLVNVREVKDLATAIFCYKKCKKSPIRIHAILC